MGVTRNPEGGMVGGKKKFLLRTYNQMGVNMATEHRLKLLPQKTFRWKEGEPGDSLLHVQPDRQLLRGIPVTTIKKL